jgi:hypothetical protein
MAQNDDVYTALGNILVSRYGAYEAQAKANLAAAVASGDEEAALENIEYINEINRRVQGLQNLHQRHIASQQPPPPESPEEKAAKPLERMTLQDAWDMAATSKHGVDPAGFQRGVAEVMARRQRGE